MDSGLQQDTSVPRSKNPILVFGNVFVDVSVDDSLQTDSKDFISESDAAPDIDQNYTEDLLAALAEDLHPSNDNCSASSSSGSDHKGSAVKKKLSHLCGYYQETSLALLKTSTVVTWSLWKLPPAHVPVKHNFELTDSRHNHH